MTRERSIRSIKKKDESIQKPSFGVLHGLIFLPISNPKSTTNPSIKIQYGIKSGLILRIPFRFHQFYCFFAVGALTRGSGSQLVNAAYFLIPDVDARGNTVTRVYPGSGRGAVRPAKGCVRALYCLAPRCL